MEAKNYRSQEINLLIASLAKAQGSYKVLIPTKDAPGGKYATLNDILLATRESLSINGLGFYQFIELLDEGSGASLLHTVLAHDSGQYISSCARLILGKTDRETGYHMEYFKRMHAYLILGIAPSDNDPYLCDDDGIAQAEEQMFRNIKNPAKPVDKSETIHAAQYKELMYELEGYPEMAIDIQKLYGIKTIADLPQDVYHKVIGQVRKLKDRHESLVHR